MAELMFVSHCSTDDKGRRVIIRYMGTENTVFEVGELDNDAINKLCGLSEEDVRDIRAWLSAKANGDIKEGLL